MSTVILDAAPAAHPGATRTAPTAPLWTSWLLAAVLVGATLFGLLAEDAYRETFAREHMGATLRGQDLLTLLTAPVLVWTAHRARTGSLRAHFVWLGLVLYVPYTYLMYVAVPYNDAFLLYVAAIGLGGFLFIDGLLRVDVQVLRASMFDLPRRTGGWFLVVTGASFSLLWLAMNLAALPGDLPEGLFVYDLPSVVHVLDLAVVLPLVITSGVLLLRNRPAGVALAAVMLAKMVTLGLALLFMNAGVVAAGGAMNVAETAMWTTIVVTSTGLLVWGSRRLGPVPAGWLRPTLW